MPVVGQSKSFCQCWFCLNTGPNGECENCGKTREPDLPPPMDPVFIRDLDTSGHGAPLSQVEVLEAYHQHRYCSRCGAMVAFRGWFKWGVERRVRQWMANGRVCRWCAIVSAVPPPWIRRAANGDWLVDAGPSNAIDLLGSQKGIFVGKPFLGSEGLVVERLDATPIDSGTEAKLSAVRVTLRLNESPWLQ